MGRIETLTHRDGRSGERGFSLFELLVVLAIMALILGLVAPRVADYLSKGKTRAAAIQISHIDTALNLFLLDVGRYPTEEEGLKVLVTNDGSLDNWNGPYLDSKSVPEDPWGRPYRYKLDETGRDPVIYTLGADNEPGGKGENQDIGLDEEASAATS